MVNDHITRVHVRNYQCLVDVEVLPDPKRTVLVGGNGAGKSSLLDAIAFVADMVREPKTAFSGENRGSLGEESVPAAGLLWAGARPGRFEVGLEFVAGGKEWAYRLVVEPAGAWFRVAGEELTVLGSARAVLLERDERGARVRRSDGTRSDLVPVGGPSAGTILGGCGDQLSYPEVFPAWKFITGICLVRPTPVLMRTRGMAAGLGMDELPDRYGRDLAGLAHRILTGQPERYADLLADLGFLGWISLATPVVNGMVNVEFKEAGIPSVVALQQASDGSVVQLWLLTLASDRNPPESVLLVDEPAAYLLHTMAQAAADALRTLSARCQVIVATQVEAFLPEFADETQIWVFRRKSGGGATATRLGDVPDVQDVLAEAGLGGVAFAIAENVGSDPE